MQFGIRRAFVSGICTLAVGPALFEEASGGVDGDALSLLVLERVEQKRVLKWARVLAASRFDLFEFAFGQRMRVRHEAADDGTLAMIDMADHDDVHLLACGCCGHHGCIRRGVQ